MTHSPSFRLLSGAVTGSVIASGALLVAAAPAGAAGSVIEVATTGNDANSGAPGQPLKTVQAAIDKAVPGTTIKIHKGTYNQQL